MAEHPKTRQTRRIAVAAAVLMVTAGAGCARQDNSASDAEPNGLKIVAQMPIGQDGKEVKLDAVGTPATAAGDGTASCPQVAIAMAGPLTGPDAPFGHNVENGAQLAVEQHNAANPGCDVKLVTFDTEGDPQKATQVAPEIINNPMIIGLVGPTWSGETKATGAIFDQAGLVAITPSATNVALSERGWKTFFRGLSSDGVQGPSLGNYLKNTLGVKKVCVVDYSTDAGAGQAKMVASALGPLVENGCTISIKQGTRTSPPSSPRSWTSLPTRWCTRPTTQRERCSWTNSAKLASPVSSPAPTA